MSFLLSQTSQWRISDLVEMSQILSLQRLSGLFLMAHTVKCKYEYVSSHIRVHTTNHTQRRLGWFQFCKKVFLNAGNLKNPFMFFAPLLLGHIIVI